MTEVVDDFVMNLKEMKEDELGMNNKTSEIKESEEIESKGSTKQKLTPLEQLKFNTINLIQEKDMIMLDITPETSVEEAYAKIQARYPSVAEVLKKEVFAPLGIPTKYIKDNKIDLLGLMQFIYERELAKEDSNQQGSGPKRLRDGEPKPSGGGGGDGGEIYEQSQRSLFRRTLAHTLTIIILSSIALGVFSFTPAMGLHSMSEFVKHLTDFHSQCIPWDFGQTKSVWVANAIRDMLGLKGCAAKWKDFGFATATFVGAAVHIVNLSDALTQRLFGVKVLGSILGVVPSSYDAIYNFVDSIIEISLRRLTGGLSITDDDEEIQTAVEQFEQEFNQNPGDVDDDPPAAAAAPADAITDIDDAAGAAAGEQALTHMRETADEYNRRVRREIIAQARRRQAEQAQQEPEQQAQRVQEAEQAQRAFAQEIVRMTNGSLMQITQLTDGEFDVAQIMLQLAAQQSSNEGAPPAKRPRGGAASSGYKNKSKKTKKTRKSKKSKKTRKSRK